MSDQCMVCDVEGCWAELKVWVPTTDEVTDVDWLAVGADCVDAAIRMLQAGPYAAGLAEIDPLYYGGAA